MTPTQTGPGGEPYNTVVRVFADYDVLPDQDSLDAADADRLFSAFDEDDFVRGLIASRDTLYEQSDAVSDDQNGAEVIARELYKAAEFAASATDVYVAGRIVELLDLGPIDLEHNITPGISTPAGGDA